eukprot:TRINITY_DN1985_c1_g1_i1.p1 TRINITY_DN1985_c1_g1~~TRINITY_DN1985_c1_g1_i1.p1  ORF type:complete len:647 (-),score=238.15 TRINITY_DN1985_c1_g1_i1:245-2185(-)
MKHIAMLAVVPALVKAAGLSLDLSDATARPVTKVVGVLKSMTEQLEKEAAEDEKVYKDYKCWCRVNGEEKLKAIAAAEVRIKEMKARIAELTAVSARLGVEIPNLGKDIDKYKAAIESAMAIRKKEMMKFTDEETDLLKQVDSVGVALKTVQGGMFLQANSRAAAKLQDIIDDHADRLSPLERRKVTEFIQGGNPGNDAVLGVLKGLQSDFDQTLKNIRADEGKAVAEHKILMKTKREELDFAKTSMDSKKEEKADADEEIMHKRQDIIDTSSSLEEDEKFAKEVVNKCMIFDREYEARVKTREDEMAAVDKATEILDGDEAHENFAKTTTKLSFLQTQRSSAGYERAMATLTTAGKQYDQRLVTLAMKAKLDGFVRVKKAIDEMVTALGKEQADEVKQRDYCIEKFAENKAATEAKERTKSKQAAKVEDLKMNIKQASAQIESLQGEIKEMQKQVKLAAQNREAENADFQVSVQDARQTQVILKKAIGVLNDYYNKEAALVQVDAPEEPAKFKAYKNQGGGNGVISMLNQILTDTKALEVESVEAERNAQENYEEVAKETVASINTKNAEVEDTLGARAKTEGALVETKEALESSDTEIIELGTVNADLHETCDFVMQNFDTRQKARTEEMDALKQAKHYLNGAK